MVSWREGDKLQNIPLGSSRKLKAEALGLRHHEWFNNAEFVLLIP
jgi:hypothetical protein